MINLRASTLLVSDASALPDKTSWYSLAGASTEIILDSGNDFFASPSKTVPSVTATLISELLIFSQLSIDPIFLPRTIATVPVP